MDKQKLNHEFLSIISESHPGLTFEEYRDSCVFLLFYHYLCLKYDKKLDAQYKPGAMVRLAVRGKLQMPAFLRFIDQASSFIHLAGSSFQLTDLSFYQKLLKVQQLEKQKSYARFFRKMIKKIDAWGTDISLLKAYGDLFEKLMEEFARAKKDSFVSKDILTLLNFVFDYSHNRIRKGFLPEFQYGILLKTIMKDKNGFEIFGYDDRRSYIEILQILCAMKGIPEKSVHLYTKDEWMLDTDHEKYFDAISVFAPEGSDPGNYLSSVPDRHTINLYMDSGTKGEFPMLLSALPLLAKNGVMTAILPGALLYREGKEAQIRRYLIEEAGCLELIMLLPDAVFHSTGQNEVLLLFKKDRKHDDIMFFDCSQMEALGEEQLSMIRQSWDKRENVAGFCACVKPESIRENDYNLNLPRYVTRLMKLTEVDLQEKRARIAQIERELIEIDQKIAMYRRDLELNL